VALVGEAVKRRLRELGPLVVGSLILVVSHLPKGVLPRTGLHYRAEHALAYGFLAMVCLLAMGRRRALVRASIALGIIMVVGAVDEVTQPLFGRGGSVWDWVFDLAGASVAVGVWVVFRWGRWWLAGGLGSGCVAEGGEHVRGG